MERQREYVEKTGPLILVYILCCEKNNFFSSKIFYVINNNYQVYLFLGDILKNTYRKHILLKNRCGDILKKMNKMNSENLQVGKEFQLYLLLFPICQ